MKKLKFYLLIPLLTLFVGLAAQEICDNGIDDDLDGFIDLNDDECACNLPTIPLNYSTSGGLCSTITIGMDDPTGISYQWYFNGEALVGETNFILKLDIASPEGLYTLKVETANGCYITEPYVGSREPHSVDLGDVYVCPPNCFEVEGYDPVCDGDRTFTLFASDGCDSIIIVNVIPAEESFGTLDTTICSGQYFEYFNLLETTAGQYIATTDNQYGCDSTITVNLSVNPEIPKTINVSICEGETYTDYGFNMTQSGMESTIISGLGQCDTLLTVNLTVLPPVTGVIPASICNGQSYTEYGLDVSVAGTYYVDTIPSSMGCDSILAVELSILEPVSGDINREVCYGDTLRLHDIVAWESGLYATTLQTAEGCDSVLNVSLTVADPIVTYMPAAFCEGDTYIYYDIMATAPGEYSQSFTAANGCDSTVVIQLEMNEVSRVELPKVYKCEGDPFILHDIYATESGVYSDTLFNSVGCDSIITVEVEVTQEVLVEFTPDLCQGDTVVVRDIQVTNGDLIEFEIQDNLGCDTLFRIQANMLQPSASVLDTAICEGETLTFGDISESAAGTYTSTLTNAVGCDSIITVNLQVFEHTASSMSQEICEGESYDFFGTVLTESGTSEFVTTNAAGCDSTITLELTVNPLLRATRSYTLCQGDILTAYGLNADTTGTYEVRLSNEQACDSLITVNLVVNAPEDLLELGKDKEIEFGDVIDIIPDYIADDLTNIVWVDQDGNVLGNEQSLTNYKTLEDKTITVTGVDSNGCEVEDTINIRVNLVVRIYFPNIFSPNNDGTNDEFIFKYNEAVVSVEEVQIYDRWGEFLYKSSGDTPSEGFMGWDGTFKGDYVNPGVYVYYVTVNIIDGSQRSFAGDVTVLR